MKPFQNIHLLLYLAAFTFCLPVLAGDPSTDVWPKPQKVKLLGAESIPAEQLAPDSVKKSAVLIEAFKSGNLRPVGQLGIKTVTGAAAQPLLQAAKVKMVTGAYLLEITPTVILIAAQETDGIFYATQTLAQMIKADGKLARCRVSDWPDMAFRGSIEGFYGKPWEHQRRLSQIRFYGQYKMNAYIYGPKDDPYSGFNSASWRDPYPPQQAQQISELARVAKENHVNFIWALHPGSSIRWHDKNGDGTADDVIVAINKLESMYRLGVRSFAVFFDDIGGEGAKAEMQAKMLNQINRQFIQKKTDVSPLLMCPTDYAGANGSPYKKTLGEKLDKDINIMWTGPRICSDIPAGSVSEVSKFWQRKPFIWWNWPVNDYCRTNLLMGRTYGLDKNNLELLAGFASNPMDKPEASKVGLFSIADWAWNVEAFDSEKSWRAAFPRLFPKTAEAMFVFAKHNSDQGKNGHGYRRDESVEIKPAVDQALAHYRSSHKLDQADAEVLSEEFRKISAAAEQIEITLPESDPALWHEIEFWVKSFAELGKMGTAAVNLATDHTCDEASRMELFSAIAIAKARQLDNFEAQKQRHFNETFASDKRWSRGCKVSTLVLTPFVDEIVSKEWTKIYKQLGGKTADSKSVFKAFSNAKKLKNIQADREGNYVSLRRILEVVKLAPKQYIGLALPEGVHGNYIHVKLDNAQAADACRIEISSDWKNWQPFNARKNGGEMQNPLQTDKKIRYFRLLNTSAKPVEFRIEKFKFDIPADTTVNSMAACKDGDITSFYRFSTAKTFTGPAFAKTAYVIVDVPIAAIKIRGNKVTINPPHQNKEVRLFEIIWR